MPECHGSSPDRHGLESRPDVGRNPPERSRRVQVHAARCERCAGCAEEVTSRRAPLNGKMGSMRTASRFRPSLLVLAVCIATFGGLAALAYSSGCRLESEMRFLDQGRAPTSDEAFAACPIEYSLHSPEANDVVFLGDSVCRYGIDPDQLQRLSGLKAFNLGSFGFMGPSGYAVTAKTYFANHPRP